MLRRTNKHQRTTFMKTIFICSPAVDSFPHLLPKVARTLCDCNIYGHALRLAYRHAYRLSQVVFFGAHTPQEYYR